MLTTIFFSGQGLNVTAAISRLKTMHIRRRTKRSIGKLPVIILMIMLIGGWLAAAKHLNCKCNVTCLVKKLSKWQKNKSYESKTTKNIRLREMNTVTCTSWARCIISSRKKEIEHAG